MGLLANLKSSYNLGSPAAAQGQVAASIEQATAVAAQATSVAADGQANYELLKDSTEAKVEEAMALRRQLEGDGPVYGKIVAVLRFIQPIFGLLWKVLCCLLPLYVKLFKGLYFLYTWAPKKAATMAFGAVLCFFGGTYVASLAAIEAFLRMGGERLWGDVVYVYTQVMIVAAENAKDEEKGGGIKDALAGAAEGEMPGPELAQRKIFVAMAAIKEPGRLENAVGSLWSAYVAVLATLSLQFAQVAALALGMAATVKPLVERSLTPLLTSLFDPAITHWVASIINTSLNLAAMCIAWYLMAVVASVYAGLRGGKLFTDALFGLIADFGLLEKMPSGCRSWLDPEQSYVDEAIAYSLAAVGIYTQVFSGFAIFFPLDYVLMPLSVLEWWLRLQVTFGTGGATQ